MVGVRVLNFDVYRPVLAVRTSPRGYWYADHPLPDSPNVLTGTEAYRSVPPRISTVTEAYRSVRPGVVGKCIFKVLAYTIGTP